MDEIFIVINYNKISADIGEMYKHPTKDIGFNDKIIE